MLGPAESTFNEKTALLDHAIAYARRGWSIIPTRGKRAAGLWKPFQDRAADEATLRRMFARNGITGLAVITGRVSGGLAVRDFDADDAYEAWAAANPEDASVLPTVRTARGYHVYGHIEEEVFVDFGDGELRADSGHYVLLPPSLHPDGIVYAWIISLPDGDLPLLPVSLRQSQHTDADPADTSRPSTSSTSSTTTAWWTSAIVGTLPTGPGQRNRCIFELARRLKAVMPDARPTELRSILQQWHRDALQFIRTKEFSESWTDFTLAWDRIRRPAGHSFAIAAAAAQSDEPKELIEQLGYDGSLRRLTALCWHLAQQWAEAPFPLGCMIAGQFLGVSTRHAGRLLRTLQFDGVLKRVTKGSKASGKASEWRFHALEQEERQP